MNNNQRYTVQHAKYPTKDGIRDVYLILDEGIPAVEVNNAILPNRYYQRPPSNDAYSICRYLNYLDDRGIDYMDVNMQDIYSFLKYANLHYDWAYTTLIKYINVIGKLYETLSVLGFVLDQSLYTAMHGTQPMSVSSSREQPDTKIWYLKRLFTVKKNNNWQSYTKWYTSTQISAISEELPIVYRIIFLLTVFYGYRCSTAISLKLSTIHLRSKRITPTYSKTKKVHTSILTPMLLELIRSYMQNERSNNKGGCSDYLLLNRTGNPVNYQNYNQALKRAAIRVREKWPELDLGPVHTHAGRSTFAAALRSFQLSQQRKGLPTFSDSDFCALMDWKDLHSLENYDKATRIHESYDFFANFQANYMEVIDANEDVYRESN